MSVKSAMASLAEFNAEINEFVKTLIPEQVVLLHKKIALEALRRIVQKTPVDTGRARGNWQTTIGEAATGEVQGTLTSTSKELKSGVTKVKVKWTSENGDDPTKIGSEVIGNLKAFQTLYITNNLVYIIPLEDGHSKQAPQGMIATTIEELRAMFP